MVQGEFFDATEAKTEDELQSSPQRKRRGLKDFVIPKLYHTTAEVGAITGVEGYVLRFWETEFNELHPHKNRSGNRVYSEKDVKIILRIKELLRDKRYTIDGARQVLKQELEAERRSSEQPITDEAQLPIIPPEVISVRISELHEIKKALMALRKKLTVSD
jgi:DNA-binding transcriptional MerR regulator